MQAAYAVGREDLDLVESRQGGSSGSRQEGVPARPRASRRRCVRDGRAGDTAAPRHRGDRTGRGRHGALWARPAPRRRLGPNRRHPRTPGEVGSDGLRATSAAGDTKCRAGSPGAHLVRPVPATFAPDF